MCCFVLAMLLQPAPAPFPPGELHGDGYDGHGGDGHGLMVMVMMVMDMMVMVVRWMVMMVMVMVIGIGGACHASALAPFPPGHFLSG